MTSRYYHTPFVPNGPVELSDEKALEWIALGRKLTPVSPITGTVEKEQDIMTATSTATAPATTEPTAPVKAKEKKVEVPVAQELIDYIKMCAHRDRDWKGGGWDVIEDTWTDEMIAAQIQGATTERGAVQRMAKVVLPLRAAKNAEAAKKAKATPAKKVTAKPKAPAKKAGSKAPATTAA